MPDEKLLVHSGGQESTVIVNPNGAPNTILIDGNEHTFTMEKLSQKDFSLLLNGRSYLFGVTANEAGYRLNWSGGAIDAVVEDERMRLLRSIMRVGTGVKVKETVKAPMPGLVVKVITEIGAVVKKGDPLVVVEAMKMENEIKSSVEGKVTDIKVKEKQAVEKNETLVVIEGI